MTNSILLTVKKMLGVSEEYHAFDIDILTNINAVFLTLNQLGVGPKLPYQLSLIEETLGEETWDDFLGEQKDYLAAVQTYVYQRVRLLFDPPTNSFLVDALQKSIQEFEWRLTVQPKTEEEVECVESYRSDYGKEEAEPPDEEFGGFEPDEPDIDIPVTPGEGGDENEGIDTLFFNAPAATPKQKPSLFDIFS